MVIDGDESLISDDRSGPVDSFVYPGEEFFDPITGDPVTGSPLPDPTPISITIPTEPPPPGPVPPAPGPTDYTLPERPVGEFVTSVELALSLADMIDLVRGMIRDGIEGIQAVEDLVRRDTLQTIMRDQALREVARDDAVDAMLEAQAQRSQNLEDALATALSGIEERRVAEIAQVEEDTGFTPTAIFSTLGDLLRDPIDYILEKSRDQIVEEISLGLNR
jgi:hypothetical protein